jgi:hypothetical protein
MLASGVNIQSINVRSVEEVLLSKQKPKELIPALNNTTIMHKTASCHLRHYTAIYRVVFTAT